MDQTLEIAVQNAKSLASNIRLTLIIWSIFAAIITAFLGLWQHKVNKQAEKLSAERDAEKARINKEEKLQIQQELESTKIKSDFLENELQRTKQAQQEAERKVAEELKITHGRIEHSQNRIPPRRLSVDQKNKLSVALKNISGGSIAINYVMNNTESLNFAKELDSVFRTAQWNVEKFYSLYNLDQDFIGLVLVSRDQKSTPHFRDALVKIFASIGFKVDTLYSIALSEEVGALILSVGKNPAILE